MTYLMNVLLMFKPYLAFGAVLIFCVWVLSKSAVVVSRIYGTTIPKLFYQIVNTAYVVVLAGLAVALVALATTTSITPKNTTVDVQAHDKRVDQLVQEERKNAPPVRDIMKPNDMTADERKKHFDDLVDYKKRIAQ